MEDEEPPIAPRVKSNMDALAYYMRALQMREQECMPIIGPSVDRRQLNVMVSLLQSDAIKGFTCFACATGSLMYAVGAACGTAKLETARSPAVTSNIGR